MRFRQNFVVGWKRWGGRVFLNEQLGKGPTTYSGYKH